MVWVKNVGMMPAYVCDSCGHGYRSAKLALECEGFCRKEGRSSQEMTRKACFKP